MQLFSAAGLQDLPMSPIVYIVNDLTLSLNGKNPNAKHYISSQSKRYQR